MAVQHAAQREGWSAGAEVPDRVTPRQTFCGPLLSALLFGGGSAGISDIYVHIRDIVALSSRDWALNPPERPLARWHIFLAHAINEFVGVGPIMLVGRARRRLTGIGRAVALASGL